MKNNVNSINIYLKKNEKLTKANSDVISNKCKKIFRIYFVM